MTNESLVSIDSSFYVQRMIASMLTATLESSLHHLDTLRREIEKAGRKDINDVRGIGGIGADLLAAYERRITYYDLVGLIDEMRDGIAKRRAAVLGVLA